jgi:chemotaxis protein MotB
VKKKKGATKVIVVTKKAKAGHGHHGGSWKVAYADFVTAMMAFFMVMWILGMDANTRKAIEGYFSNPVGYKKGYSSGSSPAASGSSMMTTKQQQMALAFKQQQQQRFSQVSQALRGSLDSVASIRGLKAKIEVVLTDEGLRIELMEEQQGDALFPLGSARMRDAGVAALQVIAQEVGTLENPVIIEGHTDAAPYARKDYTNWELSSDRAHTARRIMMEAGLEVRRIREVIGYADRHLRFRDDPRNPSNRRITVMLPFVIPPRANHTPVYAAASNARHHF